MEPGDFVRINRWPTHPELEGRIATFWAAVDDAGHGRGYKRWAVVDLHNRSERPLPEGQDAVIALPLEYIEVSSTRQRRQDRLHSTLHPR